MISKQLLEFIEKEDKLGKSKKAIEHILITADWHKDAVSEALDIYYSKGKKKEKIKETEEEVDGAKKIEISVKSESKETIPETKKIVEQEEQKVEPSIEPKQEDTKSDESPKVKVKKRKVRPVFLIILSFVLGAAIMMAISIFFLNNQAKNTNTISKTETGFEAQKIDDGKRITETLKIQEALEKFYNEHKSYPESLISLSDVPTASSGLNYTYTPIGSPPQSYTLNIEMKNIDDGEFKIDSGFLTLKNKQGTK
ncbi:hypothetical protein C4544_04995 [candidate division WS5 bacterium]|uniref:Uncharacterized protein n=1 Tax=candidate division WS5 bacterium TaxID=2093353 RepID=A0A419DBV1_9BACT|nr:MAG: hypothetical protein C4544_04995 [candidate division WS5 bacterium]